MRWVGVPVFTRRFYRTGFHPAFTIGLEELFLECLSGHGWLVFSEFGAPACSKGRQPSTIPILTTYWASPSHRTRDGSLLSLRDDSIT